MADFAWECECGNVEYSSLAPEECEKCFRIDSFAQLPEELLEERAKLGVDSDNEDIDSSIPNLKSKLLSKAKSKPKSTKPKRKKKK